MIRKLFTALLCLMLALALALPLGALAATQTTLTIVPGAELSKTAAIKDLLDVLSIKTVVDGEQQAGALAIGLSGEDVASIAVRVAPEGLFADSAVLGESPLMFDWESLTTLFEKSMRDSGADDVIVERFTQAMKTVTAGLSSDGQTVTIPTELLNTITALGETIQKDTKLLALVTEVAGRVKQTAGDYTAETHDPATQMTELTITSEDFVKLLDTDTVAELVKLMSKKLSDDEEKEALQKFVTEGKNFFAGVDATTVITAYTADEGTTLVSMSIPFALKGEYKKTTTVDGEATETTQTVDMQMPLTYDRLTIDGVANDIVSLSVAEKGKTELTTRVRFSSPEDGMMNAVLGILAGTDEVNLVLNKVAADDVKNGEIALYYRADATSLLEPAASDMPMLTIKVESKETEGAELQKVVAATEGGSLQPLKMSETELQTYGGELMTRLQQLLYTVLGKLPASVLEGLGAVTGQ